jgi:hypothetical protein
MRRDRDANGHALRRAQPGRQRDELDHRGGRPNLTAKSPTTPTSWGWTSDVTPTRALANDRARPRWLQLDQRALHAVGLLPRLRTRPGHAPAPSVSAPLAPASRTTARR